MKLSNHAEDFNAEAVRLAAASFQFTISAASISS